MITHNVQQGTPEWHALRAEHCTASEAPAMAGVSKYQTRSELLRQKHTGEVPEVSPVQQRIFNKGHAAEAAARAIAESIIGEELYPITATSEEHPHLLASFDGVTMLEDTLWEHKLWSQSLAAAVRDDGLPEAYLIQMDQQLLVSGAEKCLFMVSDGTRDNCVWCWYQPAQGRFDALLAGWEQFHQDLAAYKPTAQKVEPNGAAPETLPALRIDLKGMVTASNLPEFKTRALAMINGIKTTLATDQEFADAAETVKFLQKGEKQLEASKKAALEQTASIAELFDTIDELRETMRQKRLHIDKLVKAEKENRRLEIHQQAAKAFDAFLACLDCPVEPNHSLNIAGAMKGKKTITSLQSAADDEVARAKIECTQAAGTIRANKALLDGQKDYGFLFADWRHLITESQDRLLLAIKGRIADHKEAEQKRLEAERARIRAEEQTKEEAEARSQASEQQRIREEEAARQQAQEAAEQAEAEQQANMKAMAPFPEPEQEAAAQGPSPAPEPMFIMPTATVSPQRRISDYLMDTVNLSAPMANLVAELILTNQIPGVDITAVE
jgi:putative phage-type endonuclease